MYYINPKYILVDFLRKNVEDCRSERKGILIEKTHDISVSSNLINYDDLGGYVFSYIDKIVKNDVELVKWKDYFILFREKKILFKENLEAEDEVKIFYGSVVKNWIFWDKVISSVSENEYPRMSVSVISSSGNRLGRYDAPVVTNIQFEVSVWTKEKSNTQSFSIDGSIYFGDELAERLSYDVMKVLRLKESELMNTLFDFEPIQSIAREVMYDEDLQAFRKVVEFSMSCINVGYK
ncbi:MAG: hypothetical protein EOL97_15755 [Spirochaetia bacterium]|nr:hypothetical protein [Spirochaetia bacterium]